jgi:4-hydroxythreonine-4-phosphate dehydrogenase
LAAGDAGGPIDCDITLLGDRSLITQRAQAAGVDPTRLHIEHHPLAVPCTAGHPDPRNAGHVLALLDTALQGLREGRWDAMVTAPVQKSTIAASGVSFSGHTEYLAERCGTSRPVMMLVAGTLRVALATTHLPLRAVPDAIDTALLIEVLHIMHADLRDKFGIAAPRIAVCGLNPHNGDNGNYGDEEGRIIAPGVQQAAAMGFAADGPFPADTAFVRAIRSPGGYDGVVTMYHDQGQIAMKLMGFEQGVTVHGGLPCPITTPAHGTAYDIAGQGVANPQAMTNAFELAARMASAHRSSQPQPEETLS